MQFRHYCSHILIGILLLLCSCGSGQENGNAVNSFYSHSVADKGVVMTNWNIEWFGSTKNGPYDLDAQEKNVAKILPYLQSDLYGLCEIVDVERLDRVVKSLGSNYRYVVSDYCANATNNRSQSWREGQKMAFVYNTAVFKNVRVRGFMRTSRQAGDNFSNGRYPYLLEATVMQKGTPVSLAVLLIHAKSGAEQDSYMRRLQASNEMADSIRTYLNGKALLMMGDFNDVLQGSITGNNPTPYAAVLGNGFTGLTLSLAPKGEASTLHYSNVIDHQIVNSLMAAYYVKGSTAIRTDVVNAVPDYKKGKTSDHYPVSSVFSFDKKNVMASPSSGTSHDPAAGTEIKNASIVKIESKAFSDAIAVSVDQTRNDLQFVLYNDQNKKVLSVHRRYIDPGKTFYLRCRELPAGNYRLVIYWNGDRQVETVVKK